MKTLILTDSHSRNPVDFIKRKADEGIERLVFLGDCDLPEILEQIHALDIEKLILPGNHEYCFLKSLEIDSSTLKKPFEYYYSAWADYGRKEDVLCPENHERKIKVNGKKVILCHGLLVAFETTMPLLEGRLSSPIYSGNVPYNFEAMKQKGYMIMIRGHDHGPGILSVLKKSNPFSKYPKARPQKVKFNNDNLYIVTIGAYIHNNYAILDDEKETIEIITGET